MKGKKVLVAPLNWGLGHTTRVIPIIRLLQENNIDVTVSGSPEQIALLTSELKNLKVTSLPYLHVKFNASKSQILSYFLQIPKFLNQIIKEHRALKELLKNEPFDLIISDNCYGLWNRKVKSVIITHQINLIVPTVIRFLQPLFNYINRKLIRNFSVCWIPDYSGEQNLSGRLSHPVPEDINATYIGPLTRFPVREFHKVSEIERIRKHILFIISGPEKQRTLFENILIHEADKLKDSFQCTFIRGLPLNQADEMPENWYNHVTSEKMIQLIIQADYVVCRSGYSSIMDLIALNKPAILVATPGQTEQEYLARHNSNHKQFVCQDQDKIDIYEGIKTLENNAVIANPFIFEKTSDLLKRELEKLFANE